MTSIDLFRVPPAFDTMKGHGTPWLASLSYRSIVEKPSDVYCLLEESGSTIPRPELHKRYRMKIKKRVLR